MRSRNEVVNLVNSWVGKNEKDGSYKEIIDIYNSYNGKLPRGIKMDYKWAWCAATWSALAIKLGYTDIMPIEISCGYLIDEAKKMGCWVESDDYVPSIGDGVLYDWDDKGNGDNNGWPDHVGTVVYSNPQSGYFVVTEGNYDDSVKKRTVSINGKYIRGFVTPKYDDPNEDLINGGRRFELDLETIVHEVIAGMWGNGLERRSLLFAYGYDYEEIRKEVNKTLNSSAEKNEDEEIPNQKQPYLKEVTATTYANKFNTKFSGAYQTLCDLYLRNDAGTNKKALCVIPKGTTVYNYGFYTKFNGIDWLLVEFVMNRKKYTGFCCFLDKYLKKIGGLDY